MRAGENAARAYQSADGARGKLLITEVLVAEEPQEDEPHTANAANLEMY